MYFINNIDDRLCHILRHRLDLLEDECTGIYSIWGFCPHTLWKALKNMISNRNVCDARFFPLTYWIILAISCLGSIYCLSEFLRLYSGGRKRLTMWRKRKYYVLPHKVLKMGRLIGILVTLVAWLLLLYAIVNVSPTHMSPWLTINTYALGLEFFLWIIEVFMGISQIKLRTMLAFALPAANFLFVGCVRNVFQHAIENNEVDTLRLWPTPK